MKKRGMGARYLALCPQWTYLSVFNGYSVDGLGNEYFI
jgi:hypothetical protein